jgi:O-antigen/teichoic acid export membrane protein
MTSDARLERQALSLGTANAIDYALQFLVPIVLARTLDVDSFGKYRLLWLVISTFMVIAPLAMPQSLYYFLPRADAEKKRLYVNQTLLFMGVGGLIGAWILSPWNPWFPEQARGLSTHEALIPSFLLLWFVSSLIEVLPTVEERVSWQARITIGLSAVRAAAVCTTAVMTRDLESVLLVLVAFAAFKVGLLFWYIARTHGLRGPWLRVGALGDQVRHAAPFGLSAALHGVRNQADQWVSAALFSITMFASFSVATVLGPLVNLFRQSFNHVFLPSMSRLHAANDFPALLALNNRANMMVAALVYPILAFSFAFAEPLITLIYTQSYAAAAPVMRVYIVGIIAFVVELNSIMLLYRQGTFAMSVNGLVLVLSVTGSFLGALTFGLPGAAAGSVLAIYTERWLSLRRIARLTGVSVASQQNWKSLLAVLGSAAGAAAVAFELVHLLDLAGQLNRLALGAAIVALVYPGLLLLAGQRRLITNLLDALRLTQPSGELQGSK